MAESQGNPPPNGGQGSDAPNASTGGDGPKQMTTEEFDQHFHRAMSKRFSDFERSLNNKLAAQLGEREGALLDRIGSTLEEKLSALRTREETPAGAASAPAAGQPAGQGQGQGQDRPQVKLADLPEFKALQAEHAKLKAKAEAAEKQAAEERAKSRATNLRTKAADALTKAGIPADRTRAALALLLTEDRAIGYSDEGVGDDIVFRTAEGDMVPLGDGLKQWVQSEDARVFLPAINPKGSGAGPGRSSVRQGSVDNHSADILGGINSLLLGRN